jgi:hypothetical protein
MPELAPSSAPVPGHALAVSAPTPASFESAACCAAVLVAVVASFFAPQAGQLFALLACMACARFCRALLPLALLTYAHAGAAIFASRTLEAESSDFVVYFELFRDICSGSVPLRETLSAFGLEFGLSASYHMLAGAGACGLSIHGLAYLQTLVVSTALLGVLAVRCIEDRAPAQAALVLGGTLAMFSFIYVTQLSRQTISSLFILMALFESRRSSVAWTWLALATAFHLTAPVVYGLARLLRTAPWFSLGITAAILAALTLYGTELLEWGLEQASNLPGLDKLGYYAVEFDDDGSVGSDLRAVLYLCIAAIASLPWRRGGSAEMSKDLRLLLGFALLAGAVLVLPLAATRLTLAFSALAVGYYLFKGLVARSTKLAGAVLVAVIVLRSGVFQVFGPAEQMLWQAYDAYALWPLYYVASF